MSREISKHFKCFNIKNKQNRGWREGLAVKSTQSSSRGPEFGNQHPHWKTHNLL